MIADYCPINVISGLVKIISKLLSDRLQNHLPRLIDMIQTIFLKGGSIMETFLVTRESMIFRSKNKISLVVLKVDFEKAFDTIAWEFLYEVLRAKGFINPWILWVKKSINFILIFYQNQWVWGHTLLSSTGVMSRGSPIPSPLYPSWRYPASSDPKSGSPSILPSYCMHISLPICGWYDPHHRSTP